MAGVIEFILRLQDKVSGPLSKAAQTSTQAKGALGALNESNKRLRSSLGDTGKSAAELNNRIAKLREYRDLLPASSVSTIKAINKEIESLNSNINRIQTSGTGGVKKSFEEAFKKIPDILRNPVTLAGAGIVGALNAGMQQSREKLDFSLVFGDNAGGALYNGLKQLKPLLGETVAAGGKQLMNVGVASDKITTQLKQLGAVARGDEEKFGGLISAFADMHKEGKLTEGALAAMNEAGFKPLIHISQQTGKSLTSVRERFANGKVSITEVEQALAAATGKGGEFSGVLDKLAGQPLTQWNVLTNKAMEFAGVLGNLLMPVANMAMGALTAGLNTVIPFISTGVGLLGDFANMVANNSDIVWGLAAAIGGGAAAYYGFQAAQQLSYMWMMRGVIAESLLAGANGILATATGIAATAQGALNAAFIASPIGWVVGGMALITGGVVIAWKKFEGFRKVVFGLWETFKSVFTSIGQLFKEIFAPIGEGIAAIEKKDWGGLAKAAGKLLFNLTPGGALSKTIEFANKGGFSDVAKAPGRGAEKGAASFAASQKKDANEKHFGTNPQNNKLYDMLNRRDTTGAPGGGAADGLNAVSGGGAKNITITIGKVVERFEVKLIGGTQQLANEVEKAVEEVLIRVVASASAKGV